MNISKLQAHNIVAVSVNDKNTRKIQANAPILTRQSGYVL